MVTAPTLASVTDAADHLDRALQSWLDGDDAPWSDADLAVALRHALEGYVRLCEQGARVDVADVFLARVAESLRGDA